MNRTKIEKGVYGVVPQGEGKHQAIAWYDVETQVIRVLRGGHPDVDAAVEFLKGEFPGWTNCDWGDGYTTRRP